MFMVGIYFVGDAGFKAEATQMRKAFMKLAKKHVSREMFPAVLDCYLGARKGIAGKPHVNSCEFWNSAQSICVEIRRI